MVEDENLFNAMPDSDDTIEVDFTDTESKGFQIIERGRYVAKLVGFEKGISTAGNSQFIWLFRIIQGNYKGTELKFWTALVAKARWKVAETLEALGIPSFGAIVKIDKNEILGKQCIIQVEVDEYEKKVDGKLVVNESNKIEKCFPIQSGAVKEKDDIPIETAIKKEEPKEKVAEKTTKAVLPAQEEAPASEKAPAAAKDDGGQALFS